MKYRAKLRCAVLSDSPIVVRPSELQAKLAKWSGRNLWKMNLHGSENWSFLTFCKQPFWDDVVDLARYDWLQFERYFNTELKPARTFWDQHRMAGPRIQASFAEIWVRSGFNSPALHGDKNDSTIGVGLIPVQDSSDDFDQDKLIAVMRCVVDKLHLGSVIDVEQDGFMIHCESKDKLQIGEIRFSGATCRSSGSNSGFSLKAIGRTDEYIEIFSDIYEEFLRILGPPKRLFVNSCCEPTDVHDHVGRLGPDYGPCRIRVRGTYKKRFDPTKRPKVTDPPRVYPLHLFFDNDRSGDNLVLQASVCHEDDGSFLMLESDLGSEFLDRVVDEFGLEVVEPRWEVEL